MAFKHGHTNMTFIYIYLLIVLVLADEDFLTCSRPQLKNIRSPKFLRIKEKVIKHIPCDLTKQNYCNIPGDLYPWHSVRRFVYENQGLIRRMYGEVRQLSVLRMEIDDLETNTIEDSSRGFEGTTSEWSTVNQATTDTLSTTTPTSPTTSETDSETTLEMTTTANTFDDTTTLYFHDSDQNNTYDNINANEDKISNEKIIDEKIIDEKIIDEEKSSENLEVRAEFDETNTEVKPNLKAVNACPVKEEVVAPYWANSTRGEILALLNLYPFEQYIHWEKCNHEHKQMFCRNGCRCEQQYRLHRLLAFDPTNECRGIFSDWFRFPSCCVCKCYLTEEEIASHYRRSHLPPTNNRSPRNQHIDISKELQDDQPDVQGIDQQHQQHFFYQPR